MSFNQRDVINAAFDGHEARLREMISEDAPKVLAAKDDEDGATALHFAALNGHTATVKLLVELGIDVDAKKEDGNTALHFAAANGLTAVAKLLMDAGIDVHAKNKYGKTALDNAEQRGHSEIAALLRA